MTSSVTFQVNEHNTTQITSKNRGRSTGVRTTTRRKFLSSKDYRKWPKTMLRYKVSILLTIVGGQRALGEGCCTTWTSN
ncbi:hypothetical protein JTE90_027326 [Oedothorax gibbosus]|uniref:Uncharacterized protein n=1 Tax=Oedothorax gibbosus TaxID=931172 RepID=A0AAV6W0L0_9ARAC|nr:hypothetical protein JTE90_027326 [Oedothorax gibbosus]